MEKITQYVLLICFMVICLTGQAAQIIRIPLHASVVTLDPSRLQDISSLWVSRQINCQLVRMVNGVPMLDAIKSLRYKSPLLLDVKLKEDLKFSDGTTVTAQDVIATFDYLHKKDAEFRNVLDWIDSFSERGKYEFLIKLKNKTPKFLMALAAPHYPIFKKEFIEKATTNPSLWNFPVGCGGYKVYKNNKSSIELLPNGVGLPLKFIFTPATQVTATSIDSYDLIPMEVIGNSSKLNDFQVIKVFDPYQFYFTINTRNPLWKSKTARCALFSKLNPSFAMKPYKDNVKSADNLIPSGILGYEKNDNYLSDIRQKFGNLSVPKKKTFCVSIVATSVEKNYRSAYIKILQMIYPNATYKLIDDCSHENQKMVEQNCDGIFYASKSNYFDAYEYFQELSTNTGVNPSGYYDKKLAKLITDSQSISDTTQKAKAYHQIIQQIDNLCLMYPLFTMPYDKIFVRNKLLTPGLSQGSINEYYLGNAKYTN